MHISAVIKERYTQIEFWALTSLSTISILLFTWTALDPTQAYNPPETYDLFTREGLNFGYYKHYFLPYCIRYLTYFACFMWMNFRLIPQLITGERVKTTLAKIFACFSLILVIHLSSDLYLKAYLWPQMGDQKAVAFIWQSNLLYTLWMLFAFVTYSLFKYGTLLILSFFEVHPPKMAWLQPGQLLLWAMVFQMSLVLAFFTNAESSLAWITLVPACILLFNITYYRWIPIVLTKKWVLLHFFFRTAVFATAASIITALLIVAPTENEDYGYTAAILGWLVMVFAVAPGAWLWYRYQEKRKASLQVLQQKLGQSNAQLDQLRAQINPHFLFNALNTVYGLALTEKAAQTADAIEKISEMMRFMLRENQEALIPLEKDLDYLKNYISIQQMRIGPNPHIHLDMDIPESVDPTLSIAPMLMIPFVENAFKHGISLQADCFIYLKIKTEGSQLHFSLRNSIHDRLWLNDPEKNNHGIGLRNVRQRLALLYPDKYILDVKEDENSFNVELTILL